MASLARQVSYHNDDGSFARDFVSVAVPTSRKRPEMAAKLTPLQRHRKRNLAWLTLVDSHRFTVSEIASVFGVNIQTVDMGIKNARRLLREAREIAEAYEPN